MSRMSEKASEKVDVFLLGTGLAPLIAAFYLKTRGKSVFIANPDPDFFQEDSELPLDPILTSFSPEGNWNSVIRNDAEKVFEALGPDYPGAFGQIALDQFEGASVEKGVDYSVPHVRSRSRMWVRPIRNPGDAGNKKYWENLENIFVTASDKNIQAKTLEGIFVAKRFPGFNGDHRSSFSVEDLRAMVISRMVDVDVDAYRNGYLEYAQTHFGKSFLRCDVSQLELDEKRARFYGGRQSRVVDIREGALVFWTPRLERWMNTSFDQKKRTKRPKGVQLWEQWSLASKFELDPSTVSIFENMLVWAEPNAAADKGSILGSDFHQLSVLREGPFIAETDRQAGTIDEWASSDAFEDLSLLCHEFLRWKNFSILSMRPRAVLDWENQGNSLIELKKNILAVAGSDGPIHEVARTAKEAADFFVEDSEEG